MSALTPKREAFAAELAKGQTQAAAYRVAFPRAVNWQDATVWRRASELAADGEVRGRVDELRIKAGEANEVTMAQHVRTLQELRDEARGVGQYAAAIKAEELRGKCAGLYVERLQHTGPHGGPMQAVAMTLDEFRRAAAEVAAKV